MKPSRSLMGLSNSSSTGISKIGVTKGVSAAVFAPVADDNAFGVGSDTKVPSNSDNNEIAMISPGCRGSDIPCLALRR